MIKTKEELYNDLTKIITEYLENVILRPEIIEDIDSILDSLGYNDVGSIEP